MLRQALVVHGSPTLARLKVGSLFNLSYESDEALDAELQALKAELAPKGVALTALRRGGGRVLMYLYRPMELQQALDDAEIRAFLTCCGYEAFELTAVLARLQARLAESGDFPHEIGVFLGYPLSDVIGFIRNEGRNFLCCGYWKAYSNEPEALRMFERFRKCKEVYMRLFQAGRSLSRLTVATRAA